MTVYDPEEVCAVWSVEGDSPVDDPRKSANGASAIAGPIATNRKQSLRLITCRWVTIGVNH